MMNRKKNEIEIVGVGKLLIYGIKAEGVSFPLVNKEGKPVKRRIGKRGEAIWVDEEGKEYKKEEVGYFINGKFFNKIEKTKKVKKYVVVDGEEYKSYITDASLTNVVLPSDETTRNKLEEMGLFDGKALIFTYKKSSTGAKFHKAIMTAVDGVLFLDLLEKPIDKRKVAQEVATELLSKEQLKKLQGNEIVAKAEEIEVEI